MANKISWSLNVQVADGPKLSLANNMQAEGFELIDVEIPSGKTKEVDLAAGGSIQLVLLKTEHDKLTYKVNSAGDAIRVEKAVFLAGAEAVKLMDAKLTKLELTNGAPENPASPASVQILVARSVIAP